MSTRVLPSFLNDDHMMNLTCFKARSNLVPYAFVWEIGKQWIFSETIVVCDLKLATDDRSDKKFLLTSKLCPLGAVCPLPRGYIYILNHEINIKVVDAINQMSTWSFMSTKSQGHSLTWSNHSDSIFLNFLFSITTWPIEAKFYVESLWDEGMTKMATMPIYGEIL